MGGGSGEEGEEWGGLDSQARESGPSPAGEEVFKLVSDRASHGPHKYTQSSCVDEKNKLERQEHIALWSLATVKSLLWVKAVEEAQEAAGLGLGQQQRRRSKRTPAP